MALRMTLRVSVTSLTPLLFHYDLLKWVLTEAAGKTTQSSTYKVSKNISKNKNKLQRPLKV